jgi:flagellar hook-associated protein 2
MSTSPFTPITLNGVSQYSSDLQNVLTRAVAIAQLPVTALQNTDSSVLSQETELGSLQTNVSNLATSLSSLGSVASSQALSATSSDPSAVSVTATGATAATTYTINSITSAAAAASETSLNGYADAASTPVSANGSMELVVGANTYDFTLAANNLTTLRDTINAQNAGVTASILTTSAGNYLSVTANNTGATTLQLIDDPAGAKTQELSGTNQGTDAVFQLNGIKIDQPNNVVNSAIPGVTFTILAPSATPTTLSLATDPTQLSSALQDFVSNYNALATAVQAQEGQSAGLLSGDTVISQLQDTLGSLAGYSTTTGSINNLADLGVEFDDNTGQLTFDQTAFSALTSTQISDAFNYVGSATSGLGGFSQTLQEYADPVNGLIQTEETGLSQTDTDLQSQISTLTANITTMQTNMAAQLEAADAQIAELQSQQQTLSASLQSLSLVLYGPSPQAV